MPSGRTHDRITLWSLPLVLLLAFGLTLSLWLTGLVGGGFLFGGFMFGPDLDVRSLQSRRWGWLSWIWVPYRGSLKHRSRFSHGPVVGTLVRVLYLSLWVGLLALIGIEIINALGPNPITWTEILQGLGKSFKNYWREWLALFAGLELGALSHYSSDWLVSDYKKSRKRRHRQQRKSGRK
ncbi:MAG: metal-binding protein [Leptolyngbyaceae cyanobacterium SM1_1_3]|nr:metal-binding protein [Leptolyngbyaceae cyanobacterium SM1_1_3]NJO10625.1 metal-binding protein [Leptolyngbyaceae cyanobacterium SL_1_1]